jgi:hypothetical protein
VNCAGVPRPARGCASSRSGATESVCPSCTGTALDERQLPNVTATKGAEVAALIPWAHSVEDLGALAAGLTGRDLSRLEDRVDFYLALSAAGELPAEASAGTSRASR